LVGKDRLPDGPPWRYSDYFTGEKSTINPAILHLMRSKATLIEVSRHRSPSRTPKVGMHISEPKTVAMINNC